MGHCSIGTREESTEVLSLSRKQFCFEKAIGRGAYSQVWKVTRSKCSYAMKVMLKKRVLANRFEHSVLNEKNLLTTLHHPFIVNLYYAFQDPKSLYLGFEFLGGGDLRFHLSRGQTFTEDQTRFFAACLVLALEYLHSNSVVHRDVKPENLVLNSNGYLKLTDFGVSSLISQGTCKDTSGTPGYIAPELLFTGEHSFSADYFALGVFIHELMLCRRPYCATSRRKYRQSLGTDTLNFEQSTWSAEGIDLCRRLLEHEPSLRLSKAEELKKHEWFSKINWSQLVKQELQAPFKPKAGYNYSMAHAKRGWNDAERLQEIKEVPNKFPGFFFYREDT